jgi:exonuclease SbcC
MLYLKSIKLKNFKNIRDKTIELSDLDLISGDNGSGKSSILQAIRLCLTDSLPEKLIEYITRGEKEFELVLNFIYDNVDYEFKYFYNLSSTKSLRYKIDGVDKLEKNSDAVAKIKTFINPELLMYSSMSEQGKSYSLLDESPAKRLERFKKILGIERLGNIINLAKERIIICKNEVKIIESELSGLNSLKFEFLTDVEIPNIDAVKADIEIQKSSKKEKEEYEKTFLIWEQKNQTYIKNKNRKIELETLIESSKQKISTILPVAFVQKDLDLLYVQKQNELEIQRIYRESKKRWEDYDSLLKKLEIDLISLETQKKDTESNLIDLETIKPIWTEPELKSKKDELDSINLELKTSQNHLRLAKEGKCHTCGQDFKHSESDIEDKIKELTDSFNGMKEEILKVETSFKEYEKSILQNKYNKEKIEDLNLQIKSSESEKTKLTSFPVLEPSSIPDNLEFIETSISKLLEAKKSYDRVQTELKTIEDQILKYSGELESLDIADPGVEPNRKRFIYNETAYEDLLSKLNLYDERIRQQKEIDQKNEELRLQLEANKISISKKEKELFDKFGEIKDYEDSRNILDKAFSSWLIDRGTSFVESRMNEFFQKCYPRYVTYFSQTDDKKSIDFFYGDNEEDIVAPASLCSGFEKQLLSVSFRVALASITGIGFLVLDEVDSDASSENSKHLYSNLVSSDLFTQIIAITHKDETKDMLVNEYSANMIEL